MPAMTSTTPERPRRPHLHHDRRRRSRHHGRRHRRGLRPQRLRRGRRRAQRRGRRARPSAPRALHRSRGQARARSTEAEQAELLGRITFTTDLADLADADLVVEAVVESIEAKKAIFARARRRSSRPQTVLATNTSSLSVTEISTATSRPGRVHRRALLQPRAGAEPRRGRPHRGHRPDRARRRHGAARARSARTPSSAATRPASSPTPCSSATSTTPPRCSRAATPPARTSTPRMRFGCGYPMGPLALLDLIGLDTAYEILETMYRQGRDRLHAPTPILKQMVTAGLLGRKTGRGFYTYEGPDSPRRGRRRDAPRRPTTCPSCSTTSRRSASSAPAPWPAASSRSSPRPATTSLVVGRSARTRSTAWSRRSPRASTSRSSAAARTEEAKAEVLARVTGTTSLDDLARRRHRGRGDRRGPRDQDHPVREPRRDLQARRDPGDHHLEPADHRDGHGDQPPAGRHRHALLQPRDDHEAGRGRLHRLHRRGRHRDHPGAVRKRRQGRGLVRRPGRLHRQRAAVPLPQRRRARCSRRTTPPPTTSTWP